METVQIQNVNARIDDDSETLECPLAFAKRVAPVIDVVSICSSTSTKTATATLECPDAD